MCECLTSDYVASLARSGVLGIQGIEVAADDFRYVVTSIAEAGGTTPVIVETTDDLATEFAAGLEGIRAAAAPSCSQ